MAKSSNPENAAPASQMAMADIFTPDFLTIYGKKIGIGVLLLALAISALIYYKGTRNKQAEEDHKSLGLAMMYMSKNELDSAQMALESFFAENHSGISQAKANLLMGKTYYLQQKYAEALASYQKISLSPKDYFIITSGADHGIASCYIQLGDYAKAEEALQNFLSTYMRKNESNFFDSKVQDLSPAVPNALWKLALCQNQLGKKEEAKASANKLINLYSGSDDAAKAQKFLLTL